MKARNPILTIYRDLNENMKPAVYTDEFLMKVNTKIVEPTPIEAIFIVTKECPNVEL
jgi:hypothetical protein